MQLQFLLRKKIVVSAIILLDTLTSTCCHTTNCCCSDDTFIKLLPLEHALGVLARTLTLIRGLGQTASFSIVYFLVDTLLCSILTDEKSSGQVLKKEVRRGRDEVTLIEYINSLSPVQFL